MKKQFTILAMCMSILSCNKSNEGSCPAVIVTVMPDPTDLHLLRPSPDLIMSLYNFTDNPGIEAHFRLVPITDCKLSTPMAFHLANRAKTEKLNTTLDPEYRQQLLRRFEEKVSETIREYHAQFDTATPMKYSECYKTISDEIWYFKRLKCNRSFIVCYSNILENSDIFSCYTDNGKALLAKPPANIAEVFLRAYPLPENLNGLTLVVVFTTRDNSEAKKVLKMIEVYKKIMEPRHAQVIFQTTNASINTIVYDTQ